MPSCQGISDPSGVYTVFYSPCHSPSAVGTQARGCAQHSSMDLTLTLTLTLTQVRACAQHTSIAPQISIAFTTTGAIPPKTKTYRKRSHSQ